MFFASLGISLVLMIITENTVVTHRANKQQRYYNAQVINSISDKATQQQRYHVVLMIKILPT
jgi:hypothetical protein